FLGLDLADRLAPVGASLDHFDVLERFETDLKALYGKFLVVDDDGADGHALVPIGRLVICAAGGGGGEFPEIRGGGASGSSAPAESCGISIITVKPPSGGVRISNRWSSP